MCSCGTFVRITTIGGEKLFHSCASKHMKEIKFTSNKNIIITLVLVNFNLRFKYSGKPFILQIILVLSVINQIILKTWSNTSKIRINRLKHVKKGKWLHVKIRGDVRTDTYGKIYFVIRPNFYVLIKKNLATACLIAHIRMPLMKKDVSTVHTA